MKRIHTLNPFIALTCVALGVLWFKTKSVDLEKHRLVQTDLRDMRQLDRTSNQDILRVRFQIIDSYDSIARGHQATERLLSKLREPPPYLDAPGQNAYRKAWATYANALRKKRNLIERLKSQNAVLRNSMRYFPTLSMETIRESLELEPRSPMNDRLNRLLQTILVYNLRGEAEVGQALAAEIETFVASRPDYPAPLRGARVDTLARHAKAILRSKPAVDDLLKAAFDVDIVGAEEKLADAYQAAYAQAESKARIYRIGLYALCVVLVILVAVAFARLDRALARVKEMNESLEDKVRLRTRELDARNHDMKLVFDTVEQGFLTLDREGVMGHERSRQVEVWLGRYEEDEPFWSYLERTDREAARWFQIGFDDLMSGFMLIDLVIDQMPKRLQCGERQLELDYKPVVDQRGELQNLIVVVTDVTLRLAQEEKEEQDRELLSLVRHFAQDRSGFLEFVEESEQLVSKIRNADFADEVEALRTIHTLKGNTSIYDIASVARVCHDVESRIVESQEPPAESDRSAILDAWRRLRERIAPLTDARRADVIELTTRDIGALRTDIKGGASRTALLETIDRWSLESATERLNRVAARSMSLAQRLGIKNVAVEVEADCRLDAKRMSRFWTAVTHVVRNGLDHGVESPEERRAAGKPETATLRFSAHRDGRAAVLRFADDGRGIDWDRLADRAAQQGLPAATREDLLAALCTPGITTKTSVTNLGGRGVGMNEVQEVTAALGGNMRVDSQPGRGTVFEFRLPGVAAPAAESVESVGRRGSPEAITNP